MAGLEVNVGNVTKGVSGVELGAGSIAELVAVGDRPAFPETYADGNTTGSIASLGVVNLGDLTIYGYPYKTLTFTNAGANAATIIWGVSQGMLFIQIAGTTPNIDLTATNTNDDIFTDVPVQVIGVSGSTSGQTLGAGHFILYK